MDKSLGRGPFRGPEVYLGEGAYICVPLFRLFVVVVVVLFCFFVFFFFFCFCFLFVCLFVFWGVFFFFFFFFFFCCCLFVCFFYVVVYFVLFFCFVFYFSFVEMTRPSVYKDLYFSHCPEPPQTYTKTFLETVAVLQYFPFKAYLSIQLC